jgi:hypothetical protein
LPSAHFRAKTSVTVSFSMRFGSDPEDWAKPGAGAHAHSFERRFTFPLLVLPFAGPVATALITPDLPAGAFHWQNRSIGHFAPPTTEQPISWVRLMNDAALFLATGSPTGILLFLRLRLLALRLLLGRRCRWRRLR